MSKPGLSFGISLGKKPALAAKSRPPPRKTAFGGGDSDDDTQDAPKAGEETILELDGFSSAPSINKKSGNKSRSGAPKEPPKLKSKPDSSAQFGDLSSALTSRKYAEKAEELDPSVYDYDAAYDTFKPQTTTEKKDVDRKSRYMADVTKAAELRERDRSIAELKKIQREREAEGDEFADKEKFVTEAYKKKQEEDRKAQEEEKIREEAEAKKNKLGGMTGFHKQLLEREDQRHAEIMKAAEEAKKGVAAKPEVDEKEKEKTEADLAREANKQGGKIAINDEGEVVDKRELLRGGLNLGAKKKTEEPKDASRSAAGTGSRDQGKAVFGFGGKQAMRERQTRMMEAQLEAALKRSRDEEEEERKKIELEAKSRKTTTDISSAKERYLARKRAAEDEKKKAAGEQP